MKHFNTASVASTVSVASVALSDAERATTYETRLTKAKVERGELECMEGWAVVPPFWCCRPLTRNAPSHIPVISLQQAKPNRPLIADTKKQPPPKRVPHRLQRVSRVAPYVPNGKQLPEFEVDPDLFRRLQASQTLGDKCPSRRVIPGFIKRMRVYATRSEAMGVVVRFRELFMPDIRQNPEAPLDEWQEWVYTQLYIITHANATYSELETGAKRRPHTRNVQFDHVIPLCWLKHWPALFTGNKYLARLLVGWYNIRPVEFALNNAKKDYFPSLADIHRLIAVKRKYVETYAQLGGRTELHCQYVAYVERQYLHLYHLLLDHINAERQRHGVRYGVNVDALLTET